MNSLNSVPMKEKCVLLTMDTLLHPQEIPSLKSPEYAMEGYQAFEKISFINKSKSLFIYE